jgi:hypothetical protein
MKNVVALQLTIGEAAATVALTEGERWEWSAGEGLLSVWLRDEARWRLLREGYGMDGHLIDETSLALDVQAGLIGLFGSDAVAVLKGAAELERQADERSELLEGGAVT